MRLRGEGSARECDRLWLKAQGNRYSRLFGGGDGARPVTRPLLRTSCRVQRRGMHRLLVCALCTWTRLVERHEVGTCAERASAAVDE